MGIRTEKWNIAFREAVGFRDTQTPYRKVPGDAGGWYADPFLLERDGETWLFAEYFSYRAARGVISCCRFKPDSHRFGDWREVLREPFHLSYPQLIPHGGEIYMIPETEEAEQLLVYRASSFPDHWERFAVLRRDCRWVDTTLLPDQKRMIAYALDAGTPQACLLVSAETGETLRDLTDRRPLLLSRPGGAILTEGESWILPCQNGEKTYGGALTFSQTAPSLQVFSSVFTLSPENLLIENEAAPVSGVHTYNRMGGLEVVDYKTETVSAVRIWHRLLQKAGVEK